ncbi:MAG: HAMP domain-containing protein, partial [Thermoleophilaceae bacterium]
MASISEGLDETSIEPQRPTSLAPRPASPDAGPSNDEATQRLLEALRAVQRGDLDVRLPVSDGLPGEIAAAFNDVVERSQRSVHEVTRVAHEVGTEGKLGGEAEVPGAAGNWQDLVDSINLMSASLT